MSFLKKLLPFLFKESKQEEKTNAPSRNKPGSPKPQTNTNRRPQQVVAQGQGRNEERKQERRYDRNNERQHDHEQGQGHHHHQRHEDDSEERREPSPIVGFALVARSKNHRGLRKGSKVYVRQIFDDGERLRVRGTAPNGKKVTLTVNRHSLAEYESEGVPEHLAKHYSPDSIFQDEHEAMVKAEVMGKR